MFKTRFSESVFIYFLRFILGFFLIQIFAENLMVWQINLQPDVDLSEQKCIKHGHNFVAWFNFGSCLTQAKTKSNPTRLQLRCWMISRKQINTCTILFSLSPFPFEERILESSRSRKNTATTSSWTMELLYYGGFVPSFFCYIWPYNYWTPLINYWI